MSEINSSAEPKASFDRRSVMKGAAWSVPVIAAAIAAPAAAASVVARSLTFAGPTPRGEVAPHKVNAPASFTVKNSGAAIAGPLTFSIVITPNPVTGGKANKMARIKVSSVDQVTVDGSFNNNNAFTGTLTLGGTLPLSRDFTLAYSYAARSANETEYGNYSVSISLITPSLTPSLSGYSTITDTKAV